MSLRCPTFITFQAAAPVHPVVNTKISKSVKRCRESSSPSSSSNPKPSSPSSSSPATARTRRSPTALQSQEPELVRLCQEKKWSLALQRCKSHPSEAVPIPLYLSFNTTTNETFHHLYKQSMSRNSPTAPDKSINPQDNDINKQQQHDVNEGGFAQATKRDYSPTTTTGIFATDAAAYQTSSSPARAQVLYHPTALGIICRQQDLFHSHQAMIQQDTNQSTDENNLDDYQLQQSLQLQLIQALVQASPQQLSANQLTLGNIPLRALLQNPSLHSATTTQLSFVHDIFECLLDTPEGLEAIYLPNHQGQTPLDYLVMQMAALASSTSSLSFFCHCQTQRQDHPTHCLPLSHIFLQLVQAGKPMLLQSTTTTTRMPPLISLLSLLGKTIMHPNSTLQPFQHDVTVRDDDDENTKERLLSCLLSMIRTLLETCPECLYQLSKTSGCTVLHVALQSFGNHDDLIRLLLHYDKKQQQQSHQDTKSFLASRRNRLDNLALHVACSVGVPVSVLNCVLEATPPDLIWNSTNKAGLTPIDLEWMRHVEGGGSLLHDGRSFYPHNDVTTLCHLPRQEDLYRRLLEQAVLQVLLEPPPPPSPSFAKSHQEQTTNNNDSLTTSSSAPAAKGRKQQERRRQRRKAATLCLGAAVLDRIVLVIRAAAAHVCGSSRQQPTQQLGSNAKTDDIVDDDDLLHAVYALVNPVGATLPKPLVDLLHHLHSDSVSKRDAQGRLPLHYAFITTTSITTMATTTTTRHKEQEDSGGSNQAQHYHSTPSQCFPPFHRIHYLEKCKRKRAEYRSIVMELIQKYPRGACIADSSLRLPLHHALEQYNTFLGQQEEDDEDGSSTILLETLIDNYPDAVERRDPKTGLYPFMLVSGSNTIKSVDLTYSLLRRAPTLVSAHTT